VIIREGKEKKQHSSLIFGLNTYEITNNELVKSMDDPTKAKTIEFKMFFKETIEKCKSGCS